MKLDTHMGKNIGISPLKVYIRLPPELSRLLKPHANLIQNPFLLDNSFIHLLFSNFTLSNSK